MSADLPPTMLGAMLLGPEHIEIRELAVPRPGPGEALVRIKAATTCGTDVKVFLRGGHPRMLRTPTLFGHEFAGQLVAVGAGVRGVKEGDAVMVANSAPCGSCRPCRQQRENLCEDLHYLNGAYADFIHLPARFVARSTYKLEPNMPFERASLAEPLGCVVHGVQACELEARSRLEPVDALIIGGGPIGLLFVSVLARAGHRTVLADPNRSRLEPAARMGAATVVAVARGGKQSDQLVALSEDGRGFDVAVDCTGRPEAWSDAVRSVRPGGLVNLFGGCAPDSTLTVDTHRLHYEEITLKGVYHHRPETIRSALDLLADKTFPAGELLSQSRPITEVEHALRAMIAKQALKVVITPASGG